LFGGKNPAGLVLLGAGTGPEKNKKKSPPKGGEGCEQLQERSQGKNSVSGERTTQSRGRKEAAF